MKTRTLRGIIPEGTIKRLIVNDGQLNQGYKITRFVIAPDASFSNNDCFATLSLSKNSQVKWNWGDSRQIAWAASNVNGTGALTAPYEVLDPDHIVVQDLYLQGQVSSAGGSSLINYLVELEPVTLSDDQAVITLIKERSQDV